MKSVRIFYTKTEKMKFVSHLDMSRFMARIIVKSKIPVWYTEGFNQHIYLNYAIPLSLGYEGTYEIMDIKITDDNFSYAQIIEALNSVSPEEIRFFDAAEPILQMKDIGFAEYDICFDTENDEFFSALSEFFKSESVICSKTTKRGNIKEFDIMPKIKTAEILGNRLKIILTAGNEDNLNPLLVMNAFFEKTGRTEEYYSVTRTMIYDKDMNQFR